MFFSVKINLFVLIFVVIMFATAAESPTTTASKLETR